MQKLIETVIAIEIDESHDNYCSKNNDSENDCNRNQKQYITLRSNNNKNLRNIRQQKNIYV